MRVDVRAVVGVLAAVLTMHAAADSVPPLPSLLGFEAGRSSLAEVRRRLGSTGDIRESKNASSFPALCYRSAVADDQTFVTFRTGATYSYPGDIVALTIRAGPPEAVPADLCTRTQSVSGSLHLSNGLSLGMREEEALRLLGTPMERNTGKLLYSAKYRRDITPQDMAKLMQVMGSDVASLNRVFIGSAVIEITLRRERVGSITVARVEEPSER